MLKEVSTRIRMKWGCCLQGLYVVGVLSIRNEMY
jgi:hypothetical protein